LVFEVVVVQANFDVGCGWLTAGCGWQGASFRVDISMLVVGIILKSVSIFWQTIKKCQFSPLLIH
jgi:hypothetical protein